MALTSRGIFSQTVSTVDVSRRGVKLTGVKACIRVDEIIGLTYGKNKAHFRAKWIGKSGSSTERQIGLLNLTPERALWDFNLPVTIFDAFRPESRGERRKTQRVNCDIPCNCCPPVKPTCGARPRTSVWGAAFVELAIPVKSDADSKYHFGCPLLSFGSGVRSPA